MRHFDPRFSRTNIQKVTIYGSVITLTGSSGTADITINNIVNTVAASFSSSLTATAANWVAANLAYYKQRGYAVSSAVGVITVTPESDWDTVNRINASISNLTGDLNGTLTGVFEPDFFKAKIWDVTFTMDSLIANPRNVTDGEEIKLLFHGTGLYTLTWGSLWFGSGGDDTLSIDTNTTTIKVIGRGIGIVWRTGGGTILEPVLILTYDTIEGLTGELDINSVDTWNQLFDLPNNGTPFTSVEVVGNEVTLIGGKNINLIEAWSSVVQSMNNNLVKVILSEAVITIGDGAIANLYLCDEIFLPEGITAVGMSGVNSNAITSLVIPNSVVSAGESAFGANEYLEELTIGSGLTELPSSAFDGCVSLPEVTIPEGISVIAGRAFWACSSLKKVNILRSSAPAVNAAYSFGNYAATLHIKAGATGFNVAPWTDTAKFASIISDL